VALIAVGAIPWFRNWPFVVYASSIWVFVDASAFVVGMLQLLAGSDAEGCSG